MQLLNFVLQSSTKAAAAASSDNLLSMGCAAGCRSGKDKSLHDMIAADILPQLIESAAARRRAEEKQAAIEAMPKKRSSRLQVWSAVRRQHGQHYLAVVFDVAMSASIHITCLEAPLQGAVAVHC